MMRLKKLLRCFSLISLALLLSAAAAKQSDYYITSSVYLDDNFVAEPKLYVQSGQSAKISIGKAFSLSLRAKEENDATAVDLDYDVELNVKNGSAHVTPRMIVKLNQESVISLTTDSGHEFKMRVYVVKWS